MSLPAEHAGEAAESRFRVGPVLLRAGVTVGILALLLAQLPRDALLAALARTPLALWLGVVAAFLTGHALAALKWRLLVRAAGGRAGVRDALRAHAAGLFANLCLPSIVGGDVVRAGLVIRARGAAGAVAVGSLADRVLDTAALTGLAALGALGASGTPAGLAGHVLAVAAFGCFAASVGGVVVALAVDPTRLPAPLSRLAGPLGQVHAGLVALVRRPGRAALALTLSLGVQLGFVGLNTLLGRAVGIDLGFATWLLAWPLAKLAALVPISLGGIGVREAALAALLAPFGIAAALAVAQSLLWETVLVAGGLCAGGAALAAGAFGGRGGRALREETP